MSESNNVEEDEKRENPSTYSPNEKQIQKKTFFSEVHEKFNSYRLILYNFVIRWAIITSHISCYVHIYQIFKIGSKPRSENNIAYSYIGFLWICTEICSIIGAHLFVIYINYSFIYTNIISNSLKKTNKLILKYEEK